MLLRTEKAAPKPPALLRFFAMETQRSSPGCALNLGQVRPNRIRNREQDLGRHWKLVVRIFRL
jgi:hypothetical protein